MSLLRDKIVDRTCPVILYELIPPSDEALQAEGEAYARCAIEMLESSVIPIDGINIPEIKEEHREPSLSSAPFPEKGDPRLFAKILRTYCSKPLDVVINHCAVNYPDSVQEAWLKETKQEFSLTYLILVGGESSKINYPGPSVATLAERIKNDHSSFFCGGITLPGRKNEPQRLIEKGQHGLEFFTSQVIYESAKINQLLKHYDRLCLEKELKPKRIFLSFAPISSHKDLELLRWLGVEIPKEVENTLFEVNLGEGWRSVRVAKTILQEILTFVQEEGLEVPLGLNIEYISRHNFALSRQFIGELGVIYNQHFATKKI